MIKIILDLNKLVSNPDGLLIDGVAVYVPAYSGILTAFETKSDLTVYVQNPAVTVWFERMSKRYPEGSFTFESWDAYQFLEQRWEISISEHYEPGEIMDAGLLEIDIAPPPGSNFEDVVLGYFYGPIFAARSFPFSHLVEILTEYEDEIWKANEKKRLVYRIYLNRLNQWRKKAKNSEIRSLIALIDDDIDVLKNQLMVYKVLRFYKEIGLNLLGDHFNLFEILKPSLEDMSVAEGQIPEAINQIRYFLSNYPSPSNTDEVETLIENVSGYLMVEFDHFEKIFLATPELVTIALINSLEDKFTPVQSRIGKRITRLRDLVRPEKPKKPEKSWGFEEMMEWATQKYLPYQSWCDRNEIIDQDLYQIGDKFAEWFHENWHEIRLNSKRMVYNILPNHTSDFKQTETVNLVLIIDNLGWSFAERLRLLFEERGLFISSSVPYLSMLPSETEISKKCLLSASPTYNHIDAKNYTAIIEKGWVPYFNEASFRYISDLGKLGQIAEIKDHTYFMNYLAVDTALHTSSNKMGIPHQQHVTHLLMGLVDAVLDFINQHDLKQKIKIHVISDHGSIRIPKEVNNDLDPKDFKGSDFVNSSHRYTSVSNERFPQLPDNLKMDCFFLESVEFGNSQHYLSARRANRFLETDGTFYTHGGLTPEEVIVPHMVFEAVKEPVQDLTLFLVKNAFRYRMETIDLRMGNPNDYGVENVRVSILNSNIESESTTIPWINSGSDIPIQFNGMFKKTSNPEDQNNLTFHIRFNHRSERHTQTIKSPIEMRSMFELRDTTVFDDLV